MLKNSDCLWIYHLGCRVRNFFLDSRVRLVFRGWQETPVLAAGDILKGLGVNSVAVAKINVEGSEYEILESLAEEKLLPMLDNVQVIASAFLVPLILLRRPRATGSVSPFVMETSEK
jgi:hypothetical protein